MRSPRDRLTPLRLRALISIAGVDGYNFYETRPIKHFGETWRQQQGKFKRAYQDLQSLKYLQCNGLACACSADYCDETEITLKAIRTLKARGYLHRLIIIPTAA